MDQYMPISGKHWRLAWGTIFACAAIGLALVAGLTLISVN